MKLFNNPMQLKFLIACFLSITFMTEVHGTDLSQFSFSIDQSIIFSGSNGTIVGTDDHVITFTTASNSATQSNNLGRIDHAGIDGYDGSSTNCGEAIYSLDGPALINGHPIQAADIFNTSGQLILDSATEGISAGVNIDALSRDPQDCSLVFSIDTAAKLSGINFRPADLIRWTPGQGFSLYQALETNANINAIHIISANDILLSVENTHSLYGLNSNNHQILEMTRPGGQIQLQLNFDLAVLNPSFQSVDLSALWVSNNNQSKLPFADSFE